MSRTIVCHMNDEATVTLTREGAEAANNHYDAVFAELPESAQSAKPQYDPGDTLSTELWSLMRIFGMECFNGGPNLFQNNRVAITSRT